MELVKYGLMHIKSKKLLGFITSANCDSDFCVDVAYSLRQYGESVWLVDSREKAERVRKESARWFNADYDTPEHSYDANWLVVVEVKLKF